MSDSLGKFFDVIQGLPLHPATVHFLVVGTPVLSIIALYALVRNKKYWWKRLSLLTALNLLIALAVKLSGDALASRIGYTAIEATHHRTIAKVALVCAGLLFVLVVGLQIWERRRRRRYLWLRGLMAALLWIVSLSGIGFTLWAAHTGGQAVWQSIVQFGDPYGTHSEP